MEYFNSLSPGGTSLSSTGRTTTIWICLHSRKFSISFVVLNMRSPWSLLEGVEGGHGLDQWNLHACRSLGETTAALGSKFGMNTLDGLAHGLNQQGAAFVVGIA
jgi:hypothetical protein